MLIYDRNDATYRYRCDACGTESVRCSTLAALNIATHFGNTLHDEPPGWCNSRGQLQVTQDDAVGSNNQYKYRRGPIDPGVHICPKCRGFFNLSKGDENWSGA
jgi:hypothetical protein